MRLQPIRHNGDLEKFGNAFRHTRVDAVGGVLSANLSARRQDGVQAGQGAHAVHAKPNGYVRLRCIMTGTECREARRLLGWTIIKLAVTSGLRRDTVRIYERIGNMPALTAEVRHSRIAAICAALEAAGIEFTNGDAPGVKLRAKAVD